MEVAEGRPRACALCIQALVASGGIAVLAARANFMAEPTQTKERSQLVFRQEVQLRMGIKEPANCEHQVVKAGIFESQLWHQAATISNISDAVNAWCALVICGGMSGAHWNGLQEHLERYT